MRAGLNNSTILKDYYDKIILIVVLIVLLGSCLYLVLNIGSTRDKIKSMQRRQADLSASTVETVDPAWIENQMKRLSAPFESGVYSNQMITSELRVLAVGVENPMPIPYYAQKDPFTGVVQPDVKDPTKIDRDGDGLPDQFEVDNGLDPFNPSDAAADLDADGFSNLEEYQFETLLTDANDQPTPAAKLRLAAMNARPFKLRFQGVQKLPNGEKRFLLNMRTLEQSHFVKIGDQVEGYKVLDYQERIEQTADGKVDRSTLTLEREGSQIELIKNVALTKHEKMAILVFLIDGSDYRVRIDDVIELRGKNYKIIDIQRNEVVIRDMQTGKDTPVVQLTFDEKTQLRDARNPSSFRQGARPVDAGGLPLDAERGMQPR